MTEQPETDVVPAEGIDWSKVDWSQILNPRKISLEYETEEFRRTDGD